MFAEAEAILPLWLQHLRFLSGGGDQLKSLVFESVGKHV